MRSLGPLFICILLAACQSTLETPRWMPMNQGLRAHSPVLALAVSPQQLNKLYAATYDTTGLYVSENGSAWKSDNRGLERAPVFSLAFDGDALYAGTAAGLYRRALIGEMWEREPAIPAVAVYAIARAANGVLYVATDARGIYTRAANSTGWTIIPGLGNEIILSLLALDAHTLLAGTSGHGLFITRDGGHTWQQPEEFADTYVALLASDPRDTHTIFVGTRRALWRSRDGGESWESLSGGIETGVVHSLLVDASRGKLFAGTATHGIFISDDDGASWHSQSDGASEIAGGGDVLAFASDGSRLYAGTSDTVLWSDDGGVSWHAHGEGLGVPIVHDLTLGSDGALLAATEDGLYRWSSSGFAPVDERANVSVLSSAVAPNQPERVYAGTFRKGVFVSNDGGKSWTAAGGELGGRTSVPGLAVDPHNFDNVFARVQFERIYKSIDGGASWHAVWTGMPEDTEVEALAIAPSDPRMMYAGGNDEFFVSDNGGESWQPRGLQGVSTLAIWVDPNNARTLLAGTTDGLYESHDSGGTWKHLALDRVTVSAIQRDRIGNLLIGTKYAGVFISKDNGKSFERLGTGLDDASVVAFGVSEKQNHIFAATTLGIFCLSRYGAISEYSASC